jgi:hypothetical protein
MDDLKARIREFANRHKLHLYTDKVIAFGEHRDILAGESLTSYPLWHAFVEIDNEDPPRVNLRDINYNEWAVRGILKLSDLEKGTFLRGLHDYLGGLGPEPC